ncbi:MAG: STAS domain-containing protein [Candidatus Limnocylindria bacterium]
MPAIRVVEIGAPTAAAELSSLRASLATLLEPSDATVLVCDVGGMTHLDAALLDALARLQLTARRLGSEVRLRNASDELHGLLALAGMCDIVGLCDPPAHR